ncbi:hypothetical protein CI105_02670 [Candidatus Izimaplasma bacterium ZiA1]|uniref:endonuclease I family protein n=1 Tax=Candidatus Izimoplasma sp. ZiA1 TaxID=2024899 RepID=UPI000BAA8203|nr:hypothetical protein CI105_02670 [Candidatus Izimaplasma bacterium ZiA1]
MKKTNILFLILLLTLSLSACKPVQVDNTLKDVSDNYNIVNTFEKAKLPNLIDGVSIEYIGSVSNIISKDGQLADIEHDTTLTITTLFTYNDRVASKDFDVKIYAYIENVLTCDTDQTLVNNKCVDNEVPVTCDTDQTLINNECVDNEVPVTCDADQTLINNECVDNEVPVTCDTDQTLINNECVDNDYNYTGYYNGADGLNGLVLKSFLHNLIDDHSAKSYSSLWGYLAETDKDPNNPNNVILFYTGWSDSNQNHGGAASEWNREHVWAKGHGDFGTATGPGTDLHHIRPTDVSVNGKRASLDFDIGGSLYYDADGSTTNKVDNDSWEPRDEVKGDVARMIFYMAVRYEGDEAKYDYLDLEINNYVDNGTAPLMGKLDVLLQWNIDDPVDDFEMNRNNVIYGIQGNRNPFIDHPEFAEKVFANN